MCDAPRHVYVAGPMTGYPQHNFPAFHAATLDLRERGYDVTSPAELDLQAGYDPAHEATAEELAAMLDRDIDAVMAADAVVVLPGWDASIGVMMEVTLAEALGKPVIPLEQLLRNPGDPALVPSPRFRNRDGWVRTAVLAVVVAASIGPHLAASMVSIIAA